MAPNRDPRARGRRPPPPPDTRGFVTTVVLERARVASFDVYPYSVPSIRALDRLELHPKVTFFIGENGTGKSTLIEAIAVAAGFNAEGGSRNFDFSTQRRDSELHDVIRLVRSPRRQRDGFFLRAETLYNAATYLQNLGPNAFAAYGGKSLHAQSHGESFLALAQHRFGGEGLYILDEPEAALSPSRQLALLALIDDHVQQRGSQFAIATHSPILMAYPDALIYELALDSAIRPKRYEDTEHFLITRDFLNDRESFFRYLFTDSARG